MRTLRRVYIRGLISQKLCCLGAGAVKQTWREQRKGRFVCAGSVRIATWLCSHAQLARLQPCSTPCSNADVAR